MGDPPDPRAQAEALRHGIDISGYRGRQVSPGDFTKFDRIFALDRQNLADLQAIAPGHATAEVSLLLDVVPDLAGRSVADPYFGGAEGFETTWHEVSRAAEAIIERMEDATP